MLWYECSKVQIRQVVEQSLNELRDVIFEVEDIIKKNVFTVLLIAAIAGFVAGSLAIASDRCKKGITGCMSF